MMGGSLGSEDDLSDLLGEDVLLDVGDGDDADGLELDFSPEEEANVFALYADDE
ncbi:MAG: hypothetical protein MHM6MM_007817 [Cercozoa sp. M6MM]